MTMNRIYGLLMSLLALILAACGGTAGTTIEAGSAAPDFSLPDAVGGEFTLSDYSGRPVLLYFHMAVG